MRLEAATFSVGIVGLFQFSNAALITENNTLSLSEIESLFDCDSFDSANAALITENNTLSLSEIESLFDCDSFDSAASPIYVDNDWSNAIGIYHEVVGDLASISKGDSYEDGFEISYEITRFPGKGRGIITKDNIQMGQVVYRATNTALFNAGSFYRNFLFRLNRQFACDVFLHWAYVFEDEDDGETYIGVDLDPGSLLNDADQSERDMKNIECSDEIQVATRDIHAGEELLCSYSDFHINEGWREFGLDTDWDSY